MMKNSIRFTLWCVIILSVTSTYTHADLMPVYAENGMVAGPEKNAVQAGVEVLKQGGNAFDAAAAVGFALAVTCPAAGNLGGGGFLVALTEDKQKIALNFRETAPLAATRDMYLSATGAIVPGLSTKSLLAVGVPGTVHGLLRVQHDYGKLSRQAIMAPSIQLAERGFEVNYPLARSLADSDTKKHLMRFDSTKEVFYKDSHVPALGSIFQQPDLADTLQRISWYGKDDFYQGETADLLVKYMEKHGGIITHEDLENYTSIYVEPFTFAYKDYEWITHPLPSSGGITLRQILHFIEPLRLKSMQYHSAAYIHTLVEAERLAFADRNHHLGDKDFVDVPVEWLTSDDYLNKRREQMPFMKAGDSTGVSAGQRESEQTTHFCVVDKHHNVVAITYTLNGAYGMGAVVDGAGFLLNNEMDDFSAKPGSANLYGLVQGEANAIQPGKRMLSSMTPTIVTKEGEFKCTFGTPGGPMIITTNLQIFLNQVEFGMNIREAIDARRFHHQWLPDEIKCEQYAFSPETIQKLEEMGYTLNEVNQIGFANGIELLDNGLLAGYSDSRGDGLVVGL